jgi:glycosyltransferase involved in cell wall biosynthesis
MNDRVRVALLQASLFFGSTEAYVQALARSLDRDRFDVWLVSPDHPALAPLIETGELAGRVALVPASYRELAVVHSLLARLRALRQLRPDVVHCTEVDPTGMLAARLAGIRAVVVTHNTPELVPRDNIRGRLLRRAAWAVRPHVIFTSDADRATGLAREPIRADRTAVIPFGIDLDRFSPREASPVLREEVGIPAGRRVVGTVGLLREQKGHRYLLEAAERILTRRNDVEFVLVGDGELRDELVAEASRRGLERRVRFLGHRDDIPELLAMFDVFALSSTFEGMCLAVAEALATSTPVVATDVGGVGQTVVHGETGLLVPPRDAEALAAGILQLLDDEDEARRLAEAGRERVLRLYALPRMVAATEALYQRALDASSP